MAALRACTASVIYHLIKSFYTYCPSQFSILRRLSFKNSRLADHIKSHNLSYYKCAPSQFLYKQKTFQQLCGCSIGRFIGFS